MRGNKITTRGSVISCSGTSGCTFKGLEKKIKSDLSKVCCLRCKNAIDRLTYGKDLFLSRKVHVGRDYPPSPAFS